MNKREKFWIRNLIWFTTVILVFVGIYFASIIRFNKAYLEEEFQELPIFQKQIEWAIKPYLKDKDFQKLKDYCHDFENTTVKIQIYDGDKKLLASTVKNESNIILEEDEKSIGVGKSRRTFNNIKKHKIIGLVKKYKIGNSSYYLKLTISEEDVMKSLVQAQYFLFGFISLLIVFLVSSLIYITQKLRKPFNNLEDSVTKIANGNLETDIEIPRLEILEDLALSVKKMTIRLKKQISRLKQLEEYKSNFIQNVSHEIKTPITAINSAIELLEMNLEQLSPQNKECFDIILYQISYINSLINDILNLSEIEVEKTQEIKDFHSINIHNVIKSAIDNILPSGMDICVDDNSEVEILGDKVLLERAITNLIINAIKYSNSPTIDIKVSQKDGNAIINIIDYGVGISKEHIPHIFERFYRVDKARSRKNGGTGLGLAIVKNIIELHNGSIELISEQNKGCNFEIKIPLK